MRGEQKRAERIWKIEQEERGKDQGEEGQQKKEGFLGIYVSRFCEKRWKKGRKV